MDKKICDLKDMFSHIMRNQEKPRSKHGERSNRKK